MRALARKIVEAVSAQRKGISEESVEVSFVACDFSNIQGGRVRAEVLFQKACSVKKGDDQLALAKVVAHLIQACCGGQDLQCVIVPPNPDEVVVWASINVVKNSTRAAQLPGWFSIAFIILCES